jgi:putative resolvase
MKLSQYAKKVGVTYRTAFRWWQNGQLKGYHLPSRTIEVAEGEESKDRAARQVPIYARASSHEHCANLERQVERLEDYCAAKGYQVSKVVKEIGSGVNDNRANFWPCSKMSAFPRLSLNTKTGPRALGFAIWKSCSKDKGEPLRL